ncbi:23S rRNA pseudouridine2605 synthase [Prosthecobacter fusiformis]|uniref:Pseudouridine synthase n=1 Tax=Prosthecobacter fusiformis TaxID=48464 RepID=A0A4R7SR86_9BACT|nr:pseudouridine synthase [Prosthecobacter fusiformis]TDU81621.1 23S rRNA pseudouridine2605 synthase [Prosthecobacter fusiformis]
MRLNRYLSLCGLGSRRGCEVLIQEGRVSINGHVIKDLATQVSDEDRIIADGKPVKAESGVVIALNKPRGYICSRSDERDRMTIYSLLPKQFQTLHHVGRLDKDSEGLLLMTNRGELSHRLIHPSMGAEKEYEVIVDQPMDQATMAKLVKGMLTEEGHAKCERAWMITEYRAHVVLKQGLKRQIRLMFYQLGFEVERLTRTRIGWLELKGLQKGGWKQLTEVEVERFFSKDGATGRPPKVAKTAPAPSDAGDEDARPVRRTGPGSRGPRARTSSREERPRTPRSRTSDSEDRPRTPRGRSTGGEDRPRGPRARPSFGSDDRPRTPRGRTSDSEDRPRTPRSRASDGDDRPRGGPRSRPSFGSEDRPRGPRSRSTGDDEAPRSRPSFGGEDRPRSPRSRSSGDDAAPRSRSSKRPDDDRKPRSSGGSGRSAGKSRGPRDSSSRPPRAAGKRPSDKKGPRRRP